MSKKHKDHENKKPSCEGDPRIKVALFDAVLTSLRSCAQLDKAKTVIAAVKTECEGYKAEGTRYRQKFEQAEGERVALQNALNEARTLNNTVRIECEAWHRTSDALGRERDDWRRTALRWRTSFFCLVTLYATLAVVWFVFAHYFTK